MSARIMDSSGAVETVIHRGPSGRVAVVRRELTNNHAFDVYEVRFPNGQRSIVYNAEGPAIAEADRIDAISALIWDGLHGTLADEQADIKRLWGELDRIPRYRKDGLGRALAAGPDYLARLAVYVLGAHAVAVDALIVLWFLHLIR